MKKFMKSLMLVAVAAMALTSCENEIMNEGIESNDTHTMTFVANAPESRTSVKIDGENANFSWNNSGEKLYFLQYGGGKIHKQASDEGEIAADGSATFSVTFISSVDGVSTYTYSAIYPNTNFVSENDNWNSVDVKIPEMQVFVENSYDPAADLMVAKPIVADYNDESIHTLQFTRLAAVAQMNVKGLEANEVIQSIEFALEEGTQFVGDGANVDVENGVLVNGGNKNSITLIPSKELTTTGDAVPVFFTCFPIEYTGAYTLTIETNKATYSNSGTIEEGKDLKFTAGNVIGFNIKAGTRTEKAGNTATWYKISALSELSVGDQVALVGTTDSGSYSMTGGNGSVAPTVSKVSFNADGSLASVVGLTTFNIGKDGDNYILYMGDNTSSWIYCTSSNNGVRIGTNANKTWSIEKHSNNGADFQFKHIGTSRFLGIYNDTNWRCYDSVNAGNFTNATGTSDIAIYRYGVYTPDTRYEQYLSFGETTEFTVTLGDTFTAPTLKGVETSATYTSSNTSVATVDASNGAVTLVGVGTTTITATAEEDDDFKPATASYTITVKYASLPGEGEGTENSPYDITRAKAVIDEAGDVVRSVYVKGIVTTDETTYNSTYSSLTYYISVDGTTTSDKMEVYSGKNLDNTNFTSDADLHAGDEVVVFGDIKLYVNSSKSVYEFNYNNYIVSLNCPHEQGGGDEPENPGEGGEGPKTLWAETWTGGSANEQPSAYGFEGTTVYGGATLTYANSSANTKLYAEALAGGTTPELLLSKSNQTWTITNIPTAGCTEMTLTFVSNKTTFNISSSTDGVTVSGSGKSWTITITGNVANFTLVFKNTGSSNARIDNIELIGQ